MKMVCLVQMPLSFLYQPSGALSILKADAEKRGVSCVVDYANMRFARMVGITEYEQLRVASVFLMVGDVLFAEAAGFNRAGNSELYFQYLEERFKWRDKQGINFSEEIFYDAQCHVDRFITETAEHLLSYSPRIIGCSLTFQQNNAVFALFNKIKEVAPELITILGGVQCACESGVAISKRIRSVDYVFSGEADTVFGELCEQVILGGRQTPLECLPYGTIRNGLFHSDTPPYALTPDINTVPVPDYNDYFADLRTYGLEEIINPALLIEGSRGCWWGEKQPCTFCGLGGYTRKYRVKEVPRLLDEMKRQAERYGVHRFTFTDSILSKEHIADLIPELIRLQEGYVLFCEIKSNISGETIKKMRDAGFIDIQPGIEQLQDDMLRLMHKGNTAINHIALLRDCRTYGMRLAWNILVGFPGEKEEWLEELLALMPLLSHLQAPQNLLHIIFQKDSVYERNADDYGLSLEPIPTYTYAYPDAPEFIGSIAYNFEPVDPEDKKAYYDIACGGSVYKRLYQEFRAWLRRFTAEYNRLQQFEYDDRIELLDFRYIALQHNYTLRELQKALYADSKIPQKINTLFKKYEKQYSVSEIQDALDFLIHHYLMVSINGMVLALATETTNYTYNDEWPLGWIDMTENTV
jgi:magnesium-protoporphyrin IX monomethyl ester (oxidative) cyclase